MAVVWAASAVSVAALTGTARAAPASPESTSSASGPLTAYGQAHPQTFGSIYLDNGRNQMVYLTTGDPSSELGALLAQFPHKDLIRVERVRYSQQDLASAQGKLTGAIRDFGSRGVGVSYISIDIVSNRVVMGVTTDVGRARQEVVALLGGAAPVSVREAAPIKAVDDGVKLSPLLILAVSVGSMSVVVIAARLAVLGKSAIGRRSMARPVP